MESTLYDLLDRELLGKWREGIEKTDSETLIFKKEKELLKELEAELNEKSRKLLNSCFLAVEDRIDYIHYNMNIKILNLGVKIGMNLQKAFAEQE